MAHSLRTSSSLTSVVVPPWMSETTPPSLCACTLCAGHVCKQLKIHRIYSLHYYWRLNMENENRHFWGIVLAGGEGKRLQEFIRSRFGHQHPKQYCVFTGTRSMLRHTLDRSNRLVPRERLLTII